MRARRLSEALGIHTVKGLLLPRARAHQAAAVSA
jgi:hypothetical protein